MTPAPAKEWWTAGEIAEAQLPDMPSTRQAVEKLIDRDNWRGSDHARRRAGKGGGWEYNWQAFPLRARQQLLKAVAPAAGTKKARAQTDRDAQWDWFGALPDAVKTKAKQRLVVLQAVDALVATGVTKFAAVALVAQNEAVSERTIWDWFAMVHGVRQDDWLAHLAPRNRAQGKAAKRVAEAPEFFERLKTLYLRLEGPDFSHAYDDAVQIAASNGWGVLAPRTAKRWLDEQVPRVTQVFARQGFAGLEKCFPPQIRDRTGMVAMEGVNADCHKIDVFVLWPGVEKPMRPQVIAFQDLFSGKIIAWRVDRDPNKVAVMSAFGEMIETYGIPRHCLFDNGMEFANKWLTGGTASRFRFKVREDDPLGVLPQLGIQVHFARPAHGQAKPVERAFGDLAERVAKDVRFTGAYVGHKTDAKPENYMSRAIPLVDFMRVLEQGIADHNARLGRTSDTARGRSFDQTFAESYATAPIRKATDEQRRLWLMGQQVLTMQKSHGELSFYRNKYWSPWMNEFAGQKVIARFDPEDLHAGLYVHDLKGAYLGMAECRQKTPFFDLAGAREQGRLDAQRKRDIRKSLATHRTISVDQVAAEKDAIAREAALPVEAKVVELVQRRQGPLITRQVPVPGDDPHAEQTSALIVQWEAQRAPAPEQHPIDRFHWALELERKIERDEPVLAAELDELRSYQRSGDYKSWRIMWLQDGDAMFG
jgi:putative transposase